MRFSMILLTMNLFVLSATVYSQATKFSLNMQNTSVEQVFKEVERNSNFVFLYKIGLLDTQKKVDLNISSATVENILDQLLEGSGVGYHVMENFLVILMEADDSVLKRISQGVTITGTVVDHFGDPLPGVNILEKGTANGVITDANGSYSIRVTNTDAVLVFSFVGFLSQEIAAGNRQVISVTLSEDTRQIEEVVITALGIRRDQKAVGYSVQAVKGEALLQANSPNIVSSLSGKLAGVNIHNANQLDGGSSRIVLRGNNNIQGDNQPLIILDGIPIENKADLNITGISENTGQPKRDMGTGINFINPADIEDMNILKGPAAAALYGARGGNGVIIITTKKGARKEGLGIEYSFISKLTNPYRYMKKQNEYGYGGPQFSMYTANTELEKNAAGQFMYPRNDWGGRYAGIYGDMPGGKMTWEYFDWHSYATSWGAKIAGQDVLWWDGQTRKYEPQPDNQKYYYHNAWTTTHNISFSNGGDFGTVRVGISRTDNDAVVPNSRYHQTTVTLGSNMNISKRIKAEVMASYSDYYRHNIFQMGNQNTSFAKFGYLFPADYIPDLDYRYYKNDDGTKGNLGQVYPQRGYPYGEGADIFWQMYERNYDMQRNQLLGSIKMDYEATGWLRFMVRTSLDYNDMDIDQRHKPEDIAGTRGYYFRKLAKEKVMNSDIMGTLHKNHLFAETLNASFTLGATRWDRERYGMESESGERFKDPWIYDLRNYDLSFQNGNIMPRQVPVETKLQKRINSLYGFLDMSYGNYLYLQLTGRNDWSSSLPSHNNSYFYPSASLSFVFSELIRMPSWFNFGKMRFAIANAASDTDPYQVYRTFTSDTFGGFPTHTLRDVLPNLELKPQRSNSFETGLAVALFDYRWKFDFTFYNTISFDQIMSAPIPQSSGYNNITFNTGKLRNRGFEIMTGYTAVQNRDWTVDIGLNLAHNQNKLLSMSEGAREFMIAQIFGDNGPVIQVEVGDNYGNIYGWDYERTGDGRRIIDVIHGEGAYSGTVIGTKYRMTPTRVKIGNITPALVGGLNLNLRYKNWSLYGLADFSWGGDLWSGSYATAMGSGISPATTKERNGGGLPYTYYTDGSTANHGIKMDGVLADGSVNNHVVHYIWEYVPVSAYGRGNRSADAVFRNNWIKMRELAISYTFAPEWIRKSGVFQSMRLSLTGRDLFYFYSSLPDRLSPEALSNSAGNAQGLEFGALPGMRSFSFSVNVNF